MKIWTGSGMRKIQEGDQLWRGQQILEIPDLSKMINVIQIDEVDISKIKEGQDARITVDALPELELFGKVTKIATLAQEKGKGRKSAFAKMLGLGESVGVKTFEVTIELNDTPKEIKPGMTTKTVVTMNEFKDALYIPVEAVFDHKDKRIAYVTDGSRLEKRELVLGESNENYIIVKKGLKPGEEVVLLDPAKKLRKLGIKQSQEARPIPKLRPDDAGKD
jgi:HlyD family secretion protein